MESIIFEQSFQHLQSQTTSLRRVFSVNLPIPTWHRVESWKNVSIDSKFTFKSDIQNYLFRRNADKDVGSFDQAVEDNYFTFASLSIKRRERGGAINFQNPCLVLVVASVPSRVGKILVGSRWLARVTRSRTAGKQVRSRIVPGQTHAGVEVCVLTSRISVRYAVDLLVYELNPPRFRRASQLREISSDLPRPYLSCARCFLWVGGPF